MWLRMNNFSVNEVSVPQVLHSIFGDTMENYSRSMSEDHNRESSQLRETEGTEIDQEHLQDCQQIFMVLAEL